MPNKNIVVNPENVSAEAIKQGESISAEDDYSDIIDIINKNREKTIGNDFNGKY